MSVQNLSWNDADHLQERTKQGNCLQNSWAVGEPCAGLAELAPTPSAAWHHEVRQASTRSCLHAYIYVCVYIYDMHYIVRVYIYVYMCIYA